MKFKYFIFILLLIQLLFAKENNNIEKKEMRLRIKNEILTTNFQDTIFHKHPEYIQLKNNLKIELKNLRKTQFKDNSLYMHQIKLIKTKNDSLILDLFRKISKK
jgi:hypothetical protein